MRKPRSDDQQWYDMALSLGILSFNKDEWNYAAHYAYQGKINGMHAFKDVWNGSLLRCDFDAGKFWVVPDEYEEERKSVIL